jgi:hypothetical protein
MPSSQQIAAGQRATGSVGARAVPILAYKAPPGTSQTSNTTLTADPDLVLALGGPFAYEIKMLLINNSSGTNPGFKYAFTVSSAVTGDYMAVQYNLSAGFQSIDGTSWTTSHTADIDNGLLIEGLLLTTVATTLTLTWAQSTSNATPTTVGAYSYLRARQAM